MMRPILRLVVTALCALCAVPAVAHLTPNSELTLTIQADAVVADVIVPQGEYAYATGNPIGPDRAAVDQARAYLGDHFAVRARDGRRWMVEWQTVEFVQIAGPPDLHAVARLTPPPGTSTRTFEVRWTALLDELPSHFALIVLAGDTAGMIGSERVVLGAVRQGTTSLTVDRGQPRQSAVFVNAMLVGMEHILEGYDHLLFLLALLLPAPLIARGGRWMEPRPLRQTAVQLVRIVTAFTIGHSLTLVAATLGGWRLPTAPVEVAIAVSVLLSAVHAMRPLVPGREHWVAAGFGLVHGLAFATLLSDAHAGQTSTAINLLGFNLGIEAVQLAIVVLVVPPLLVLSRTPLFTPLRILLALATAIAATVWIADRTFAIGGSLAEGIELVVGQGPWAIAGLYALAAFTLLESKRAAPQDRPSQIPL